MRSAVRRTLTTLTISCLSIPAADAQTDASEQDYFQDLPVVLSVSRLAQPLDEAPGAVTVIDREMIRQSGARQVVDLLRLVPGFQVASLPTPNGSPVAVYHGLTEAYPRHMQVLLDGRSQYSAFFVGGVNWNTIPVSLNDIDRIEVIRGSNSAAYGSNAVLGVVNIITRHSQETVGVSASVKSGTQSVNDKHIRLGSGGGDFSMRYSGETLFDDGFDAFRDNTSRRLHDMRADWRVGPNDEIQLQAGEITTSFQTGSAPPLDPLREQTQSQQYAQAVWRRTLGNAEEIGLRYYHVEEGAVDNYQAASGGFTVPFDFGFRSRRDDVELTHIFSPWRDTRLVWGGEVRTDSLSGRTYYGTSDAVSLRLARLFGNIEWRMTPAWIANAGATWENDSNSKTTFAPRLAMNWHVSPGQTLRAAVSQSYRTPSLFETRGNYTFSSNTGIALKRKFLAVDGVRPESITSTELGWIGEFKPLALSGDVRIFSERLRDRLIGITSLLTVPNCVFPYMFIGGPCGTADNAQNVQDVRMRGIEYQWRWQPTDSTRLLLNQSFIRIAADMRTPEVAAAPGSNTPAQEILFANNSAPSHATTLMWTQRLPGGFDLSAIYHSVGAMKWGLNTYVPLWQRLDWRLAYPFHVGTTRGELAFAVQSDGRPHAEHAASELVSRRGFVSLRLDY